MSTFLTNINLNKNELQNAVVQNLGSEPQEPKSGQFYYDSVANKLKIYNGTSWVVLDQQTAESIVNLINAGGSKIDKSKVKGLEEAINQASMTGKAIATALNGDTVIIVRKNGQIFDYVLPNEKIRDWEVVTEERVEDVLDELDYIK